MGCEPVLDKVQEAAEVLLAMQVCGGATEAHLLSGELLEQAFELIWGGKQYEAFH